MVARMTLQNQHDTSESAFCSTAEAAAMLNLTTMHVGRLAKSGALSAMKVGKLNVFNRAEVEHLRRVRDGVVGDVIDRVDVEASANDPGEDRNAMTRAEWLAAVRHVVARTGGTFHSGQVRALVPEDAHGPASGAFINGLVRRRVIEHTGEYAEIGDSRNRHGSTPCKVYRVTGVLS